MADENQETFVPVKDRVNTLNSIERNTGPGTSERLLPRGRHLSSGANTHGENYQLQPIENDWLLVDQHNDNTVNDDNSQIQTTVSELLQAENGGPRAENGHLQEENGGSQAENGLLQAENGGHQVENGHLQTEQSNCNTVNLQGSIRCFVKNNWVCCMIVALISTAVIASGITAAAILLSQPECGSDLKIKVGQIVDSNELSLIMGQNMVLEEKTPISSDSEMKLVMHMPDGSEKSKIVCTKCSIGATDIVNVTLTAGDVFCATVPVSGDSITSFIQVGEKNIKLYLLGSVDLYYIQFGDDETRLRSDPITLSWDMSDICWA